MEAPDGGSAAVFASGGADDGWRTRLGALPSLDQSARDIGVSVRTVQRAKNGDRDPSAEIRKKILAALTAFAAA